VFFFIAAYAAAAAIPPPARGGLKDGLETSVVLALSFTVCVVLCSLLGTEVVQVSAFFCTGK
jgi:hypothetical protein